MLSNSAARDGWPRGCCLIVNRDNYWHSQEAKTSPALFVNPRALHVSPFLADASASLAICPNDS